MDNTEYAYALGFTRGMVFVWTLIALVAFLWYRYESRPIVTPVKPPKE